MNVPAILLNSCTKYKQRDAICFLNNEQEIMNLTYQNLFERVYDLILQIQQYYRTAKSEGGTGFNLNGKFVVLTVNEGTDCIISFLAIFFLNGVAVPIDENDPRLNEIIEECNPVFQLTKAFMEKNRRNNKNNYNQNRGHKIQDMDTLFQSMVKSISLNSLCYMIYTSGSTGKPKGVLVEHRNIMTFMEAKIRGQNISEQSRVFLCTSFTFDPYIGDALATLQAGGTICLAPKALMHSSLHSCLYQTRTTHIFATPTMWSTIDTKLYNPNTLPSLQYLALGGEQMKQEQLEVWGSCLKTKGNNINSLGGKQTKLALINTYGTTEATVVQMQYQYNNINSNDRCCVGKAMHGNNIFIVDPATKTLDGVDYRKNNFKILPNGSIGEIVFAGNQVTRGYYKRPDLTNNKYFNMSLISEDKNANGSKERLIRCFRSGDLGKINEKDGTLCLFGRIDNQVKIRGYRVELGEIENAVMDSNLVNECVCNVDQVNNATRYSNQDKSSLTKSLIVMYIIPLTRNVWSWAHTATLQSYCSRVLPMYMQPHRIIALKDLDTLPKTSSMKIDRNRLSTLNQIPTGHPYHEHPPITRMENAILKVWSQIIGISHISRYDNFFRLGGDSLGALRCVRILWKDYINNGGIEKLHEKTSEFGDIDSVLSPSLLLQFPVLKDFAAYIEKVGLSVIDDGSNSNNTLKRKQHPTDAESNILHVEKDQNMLALCEASRCGYLDVVRSLLIKEHVDPNCGVTRKNPGITPLHVACSIQVVDLLICSGAKLTLPAPGGLLPIHNAASNNSCILQKLIELKVPMLAQDQNKQIAIHHAARSGNVECVQILIKENKKLKRTFLDTLDRWNRSPLHWAILNNHFQVVSMLIQAGARVCPYNMSKIKHLENIQGHRTRLPLELPIDMAIRLYSKNSLYYKLLSEHCLDSNG